MYRNTLRFLHKEVEKINTGARMVGVRLVSGLPDNSHLNKGSKLFISY